MPEDPTALTREAMMGLLAAGASRVTRALRAWEPPGVEVIQRALPQYEIVAFLARGGMGAVYKGVQRSLGREVAIKVLPPDIVDDERDYVARFKQEARAMAALSHPNIVAVYEAGEVESSPLAPREEHSASAGDARIEIPGDAAGGGGRLISRERDGYCAPPLLYFVMEFVEGTDLARLVLSEGRLDTARALEITRQVCEALAFAHESGIVHRDIKPSNIMLDKKGRVKVADFGLARMELPEGAGQLTGGGLALGTPDYMAPEALASLMPVDQRADLYAVGVMLYQMLTGDVPRGRFPLPSAVVPGIDARLDAIVEKAMQTDREQRYSSAVEMRRDVESVTRSSGLQPPGRGMAAVANRRSLIFALAAVLVVGGAAWQLMRPGKIDARVNELPAAIRQSSTPTRSWVKVNFVGSNISNSGKTSRTVTAEDIKTNGGLKLMNNDLWFVQGVPGFGQVQNGAIRVRFKCLAELGAGARGSAFNIGMRGEKISVAPNKANAVVYTGNKAIASSRLLPNLPTGLAPSMGEEMELEIGCLGKLLVAKRDGTLIGTRELPKLDPAENFRLQGSKVIIISAEVINLDGLPEAEALKVLGVDAAGRADDPPSVATPQGPHWSQMPTEEEKKLAFTNTLGMKFVPVPGTEVLFCIHETRKGDYAAYAAANSGVNDDWRVKLDYPGGKVSTADDHPVVRINTADAQAFCAWLSAKEGRNYRLPTDHEWSCAAGIGEREEAGELPINKAKHLKGIYVWGLDWPPPPGAGNVGDESLLRMNGQKIETDGYDDGYGTTAPVMSFKPNALGIHDLVGNVWERCPDWFDTTRTQHLGRGESFNNAERNYLHASVRNSIAPEIRQENYGFRVVVEKMLAQAGGPLSHPAQAN